MKRIRRYAPSSGFVLLLMSHAIFVVFLAWGYSQPELDRAWHILQKMQRDKFAGLATSDVQTLESLLRSHPQFVHALIGRSSLGFVEPTDDGWLSLPQTHLVIHMMASVPLILAVECRGERRDYPLSVALETPTERETLEFSEGGQRTLDWSDKALPSPALIRVSVRPRETLSRVGARPEIRIRLADTEPKEAEP